MQIGKDGKDARSPRRWGSPAQPVTAAGLLPLETHTFNAAHPAAHPALSRVWGQHPRKLLGKREQKQPLERVSDQAD